jgi:predicted anti-sigma-YlaC factor YlaD
MDCLFIRNHLFSFYEKQLSEEEKNAFTEHLKSCGDCLAISRGVESLEELIKEKKSEQPNPFIHTRTIQRIESETEKSTAWYLPVKKKVFQPLVFSVLLLIGVGAGSLTGWLVYSNSVYKVEQQQELESIKTGLSIDDFIDEGHLSLTN